MNCEICLFPYDHSKRKPYVLSCPHRFCLDCMNHKLTNDKRCPICLKPIRSKFPNLTLMKTLPESNYDKTRKLLENSVLETNDLKQKLNQHSEKKFADSLAKIRLQRNQFNKQSNELINLIQQNQTRLLDEFDSIENKYNQNLNEIRSQCQIDLKVKYAKNVLETNELDENELINLKNDFESKKMSLNNNIQQIDAINVNYEIFYNKNINVQTGLIAEIKKAEKTTVETTMHVDENQYENKENTIKKESKNIQIVNNKLKTFGLSQTGSAKKAVKDSRLVIQKDSPKKRKLV